MKRGGKILSQDKSQADAIKIQTDGATILDDQRKDGQDHHSLLVLVVSAYRLEVVDYNNNINGNQAEWCATHRVNALWEGR